MNSEIAGAAVSAAPHTGRLNLALLRRAVHGWWLGNPLVEARSPITARARAVELVAQDARTGTVVIHADDALAEDAISVLTVVVLLPADLPAESVIAAAAETLLALAKERYMAEGVCVSPEVVRFAGDHTARLTFSPDARRSTLTLELLTKPRTMTPRALTPIDGASPPWEGRREEFIAGWLRRLNQRLVARNLAAPDPAAPAAGTLETK